MSGQFTGTRKSRPFGLYKPHYLPNLHRVSGSYFRPRSKRRGQVGRRPAAARVPLATVKKEPRNVTWLPGDDYLLINSVLLTCNLTEVHHTVRFATQFTEKEIEARWHALLFDPVISRTALQAMARLPPLVKTKLNRLVPFSDQEDALIAKVTFWDVFRDRDTRPLSSSDLRQSVFAQLLTDYPAVFFSGRDELDLYRQWNRLQSCHVISQGVSCARPHTRSTPGTLTDIKLQNKSTDLCLVGAKADEPVLSDPSREVTIGGDPESFSDTELLLEETVANALSAGLDKLTEPSTAARRHRLLAQSSYHGFQSLVTESVISALAREKQEQEQQQQPQQSAGSDREDTTGSGRGWLSSHTVRPRQAALLSGLERPSPGPSTRAHPPPGTLPLINSEFDFRRRMELCRFRKRLLARLRRTAEEAKRWTNLVEISVAGGLGLTDLEPIYPTLAALTGTRTRWLLKEEEVTFGRSSLVYKPDIDLSWEGDSSRVSRCHGRIRLAASGVFWLANFSKHPVFVDGNPVLTDEEVELKDLATVLIARLTFRFDVNQIYVNALCHLSDSSTVSSSFPHDEPDTDPTSVGHTINHSHTGNVNHTGTSNTGTNHTLHSSPSVAHSEPSSDM